MLTKRQRTRADQIALARRVADGVAAGLGIQAEIERSRALRITYTEPQGTFVGSTAHHLAFIAGIASGKSYSGSARAALAAMGQIGERRIPTPNLGVITAPTYPMLKDATLRAFMDVAGHLVAGINRSELTVTMVNGSEILFRSTEHPDRLRGPSISWWWGDEAALYRKETRNIMLGRLRQFGRQGFEWITTTPRGRNWVWQSYVRSAGAGYVLVRSTTQENTFLDRAIIEDWEREYGGDYAAQELGGEFVAYEGLVYGDYDETRHIRRREPHYVTVYAGVDWGYVNPGVITVAGLTGDGHLHVVAEAYHRQRTIDDWVSIATELRNTWNIEAFYCDPSEPKHIQKLRDAGLKAQKADNEVIAGINAVKGRLAGARPRLTFDPSVVNLLAEFDMYEWASNTDGFQDRPVKANDHAQDSLRYLVMGVDHPRRKAVSAEASAYL
jgi:PBSX family phage terminase large subunit